MGELERLAQDVAGLRAGALGLEQLAEIGERAGVLEASG